MKKLLLTVALLLPLTASAMGGSWAQDWWDNVYKQRIQREQYEEIEQRSATRCETKIEFYVKETAANPDSDYLKWKLEVWMDKCKDELQP